VPRDRLEGELRKAYERNQAIGQRRGVLSLSGRYDDSLKWAHYADSRRRICIGFDFDIDALVESDFIPFWVDYADELPVLDPGRFFDGDHASVMDMLKIFHGANNTAWKHEAEFKLVSKKGDLALDLPGRINEVILGEKITTSDVQKVLAALEGRDGAKFFKMIREPGTRKYRAYGISI
jgi:hypothetical protein